MHARTHVLTHACGVLRFFVFCSRAALALELVAAHNKEAAEARQQSALNAAKFRRASRDIGQGNAAALIAGLAEAQRVPGGRPPTPVGNRCVLVCLRACVHGLPEVYSTILSRITGNLNRKTLRNIPVVLVYIERVFYSSYDAKYAYLVCKRVWDGKNT